MKVLRITAYALLAAFIGTCGYLAYQSDPGKVQREIDKSKMIGPNSFHKVQHPPCWPLCDDQQANAQIAAIIKEASEGSELVTINRIKR